jgi:hypothetical protein
MRTQLKWSPGPGVKVLGITLQDEENWVVSAAAKPVGICPDCGRRSRHRHGWHNRRLQDLPVQGQVVKIKLALNRWQCRHRKCGRRTFTDRLPEIASPYTRRTERMAEIVRLIGHKMGGRPGEYLMHRLGMPVSDDTKAPFGRGINFQIEVEDVDPILMALAEARWPLFRAPNESWYRIGPGKESGARELLVQDLDGYLVRLSQNIGKRTIG